MQASRRTIYLLGLALLLVPSFLFIWKHSDMPGFGDFHDDSVYYVSAKSLAEGQYRIESLPDKPAQTKYPPLYPLLLSIAWRIQPQFPENLTWAGWISWLSFPALLFLLAAYYPRMGISGWRMWVLLGAIAANPYIVLFSASLLSELFFTALLIGVLLLIEKAVQPEASAGWALAAGLLSGLAYLARSAGIVLLGSAVLYLWMNRQRNKAYVFAGAMLPFVAGWTLWARFHQFSSNDIALIYYTDYFRYELINVSLSNLHLVLWKNIDGMIWGLGSFMMPKVTDSTFLKTIAVMMAVAMISGIVRMVRTGRAVHYAIFAAGSAFMLAIWHFPPNERFVLPLLPLGMAGLLREMEHFAGMVRANLKHRDRSQRVTAAVLGGTVIVGFLGCFAMQWWVTGFYLDHTASEQRKHNVDNRSAYAWMRSNLPPDAAVVAYDDPVLYLYTGHLSISRPLPTYLWYAEDHDAEVGWYRELAGYAREHRADFFYHTTEDLRRDLGYEDTTAIEKSINSNPQLKPIFHQGIGTIYRVE